MNIITGKHDLLVQSKDQQTAEEHVRSFFAKNELVRYDTIHIDGSAVINATKPHFFNKLEIGIQKNRQAIEDLVAELQTEGAADPKTWSSLQQGYSTKILHTVVHLLDGFFGVDSVLYNLVENSHQISEPLYSTIKKEPETYWLVPITGTTGSGNPDRVQALRPFGRN